ncbi:uncharacterized protein LOC126776161 [Nymphalis io]|uniref:uncharacterized protein LOC126776161 n=1 Tax=Inachis io TaxID=171585 RepID=UPI00216A9429|nr:uncharacterized protein LOC126776161 [Nymphalis io]
MKFLLCTILLQYTKEVKFVRTIEAIGLPYYKISLKLGTCQERILFSEHKAWPIARMNRIMDIYYKSEFTVSSVEIKLVINDTDCLGSSKSGVGSPEFTATIFLATNMAVLFYSLTIYTCNHNYNMVSNEEGFVSNLLFYTKLRPSEKPNIL